MTNVTKKTIVKQHRAFNYVTVTGRPSGTCKDRLQCKDNFEKYLKSLQTKPPYITTSNHSNKISYNSEHIEELISYSRSIGNSENVTNNADAINILWASNTFPTNIFKNCIAMLDTSGSMEEPDGANHIPLNSAIGLAIRIMEGSSLGRRLLTFSSRPKWLNFDKQLSLTDIVKTIMCDETLGLNSNLLAAMELIAEACRERDMHPSDVNKLTLVVLSDMNFDKSNINQINKDYHKEIKDIFKKAGLSTTHNAEYLPPKIIYWNMKNIFNAEGETPMLPVVHNIRNVSYLSGYSPSYFFIKAFASFNVI